MKTREFVDELKRMMDSKGRKCGICDGVECNECPLGGAHDCIALGGVDNFGTLLETIEVVEKWSEEHPRKTYKDVLLERFPNAKMMKSGEIPFFCPDELGFDVKDCDNLSNCVNCWNSECKE